MKLHWHTNAITTPTTRTYIYSNDAPVAQLAREPDLSQAIVRRRRSRQIQEDRAHRRYDPGQGTTPQEEALIAELRPRAPQSGQGHGAVREQRPVARLGVWPAA